MSTKRKGQKLTSSPGSASKKKKPTPNAAQVGAAAPVPAIPLTLEVEAPDSVPSPAPSVGESDGGGAAPGPKVYCFKDPAFPGMKPQQAAKKGKAWRNLKQIMQSERSLPWKSGVTLYHSIEAPPSFRPAKKYSDLSGLPSTYTDPHSKLRYASTEEYSRVTLLPSDIVTGLLALRKANSLVQ